MKRVRIVDLSAHCRGILLAVAVLVLAVSSAAAADFPNGPVRWIVPEPTGGSYDAISRGLAPFLGKALGVPVIVQNIPGPEGVNQIYRAKPDGQTIGNGDPMGEFAREIVIKPDYKIEEMTWIGRLDAGVNLLVASKQSGIKSFADLENRKTPVRAGVFGLSAPFVQMILLSGQAHFTIAPVNYRNISELIFGVVRGDTDVAILGLAAWIKHVEAGNVVPLMEWTDERDDRIPNVPALKDVGHPELIAFMNQRAIIAPPHVPDAIRAKLTDAFAKAIDDPQAIAFMQKANFEHNPLWGAEFEKIIGAMQQEMPQYAETLRRLATQ